MIDKVSAERGFLVCIETHKPNVSMLHAMPLYTNEERKAAKEVNLHKPEPQWYTKRASLSHFRARVLMLCVMLPSCAS